ncbi:Serine hydrolase [Mesorhizobium sp. NFR06]|nr:Serine hydrolase [Mesorhizobium sp. NFR06]
MQAFITLPGIGGSGDAHWQSHWERADKRFKRFEPTSWDMPDLSNWIGAVDNALLGDKDKSCACRPQPQLSPGRTLGSAVEDVGGGSLSRCAP